MTGTSEPTEKLAAILAADVVGYSRLMRADERRTVGLLDDYRAVFREAITAHGGRVVDMAGDSVLAVFDSVSAAVNAAVVVQTDLTGRNATYPADQKMEFRIGINLGDILEKHDGTVYGDGVNVAARLEALADPGGINVSGSVFNSVRSKISAGFEFLGEQDLKNIANPVSVYRLIPDGLDEASTATTSLPGADSDTTALPTIVVAPLSVISGDSEVESLAAGLQQDLLGGLTRQSAIAVLSSGEEANADFRLEGNIRAAGGRLRLSFALVDIAADRQVWSERYDRNLEDLFDLEDEISYTVAANVRIRIKAQTFEKLRDSDDAGLATGELLSKAAGYFVTSYEHNDEASAALRRVLEREPAHAMANAMLVMCQYREAEFSPLKLEPATSTAMADRIADALSADPGSYFAHLVAAIVHQDLLGDFAAARVYAETALEINPGFLPASGTLGVIEIHTGDQARGCELLRNAIAAAPDDPHRYRLYRELALARFAMHEYDAAIEVIGRLNRLAPKLARNRLVASALMSAGDRADEAASMIRELREAFPDLTCASARPSRFHDPDATARFATALRDAGLPD